MMKNKFKVGDVVILNGIVHATIVAISEYNYYLKFSGNGRVITIRTNNDYVMEKSS